MTTGGGRLSPKVISSAFLSLSIFSAAFFSVFTDNVFASTSSAPSFEEAASFQRTSLEDFEGASFYFTVGGDRPAREDGQYFSVETILVREVIQQIVERTSQAVSLLSWNKINKSPSLPKEKYDRSYHFGTWIVDPRDPTCLNTRQRLLYVTSKSDVQFRPGTCQVESGEWHDPYTGSTFRKAEDLQIDHVVPLKNAFVSGAWKWSKRQRCVYTNFLGNAFHLLPVSAQENMRKSDRTPARYLPPHVAYRCEYLRNWLLIKLVWKLAMNPLEAEAIQSEFQSLGCSADDFEVRSKYLQEQRQKAQRDLEICQN